MTLGRFHFDSILNSKSIGIMIRLQKKEVPIEMKIKKMKNSKTTKEKWELKMKHKEPLQSWIVNIMSSTNLNQKRNNYEDSILDLINLSFLLLAIIIRK